MRDFLAHYGVDATPFKGVQVLVAESLNSDRSASSETWRAITALVVVSADASDHRAAMQLRQPGAFHRTKWAETELTRDVAQDVGQALKSFIEPQAVDYANAILQVEAAVSSDTVQRLVDLLRQTFTRDALRVALVCTEPLALRAVHNIEGYVAASADALGATAAGLFQMLTADIAPSTLACMDFEDLGFSAHPERAGRMVCALWQRESAQLVWERDADKQLVARASHVSATFMLASGRLAECRELCSRLRDEMSPEVTFSYGAPVMSVSPAGIAIGFGWVLMLVQVEGAT